MVSSDYFDNPDHLPDYYDTMVTIQNDKKLYTCTKEILKYRIAGLRMKKV